MAKRRTRGDGSLHLRKDGRWEGALSLQAGSRELWAVRS